MEQTANQFLGLEPVGRLMKKYAVPCIISLLVGALYNIVDQIFIANASYLGSYGNAANTVVFPLTVIALAIAVMIGDGCCCLCLLLCRHCRNSTAGKAVWVLTDKRACEKSITRGGYGHLSHFHLIRVPAVFLVGHLGNNGADRRTYLHRHCKRCQSRNQHPFRFFIFFTPVICLTAGLL